jgi:hypothetical protein
MVGPVNVVRLRFGKRSTERWTMQLLKPAAISVVCDGICIGRADVVGRGPGQLIAIFSPNEAFAYVKPPIVLPESCTEKKEAWEQRDIETRQIAQRIHVPELPDKVLSFDLREDGGLEISIDEPLGIRAYVRRHPPRCIRELQPTPLPPEKGVCFAIGCPCGERSSHPLGYEIWSNDVELFAGPLAIECAACGRVAELFDTRQHGFQGEHGVNSHYTGEGERSRFSCPHCGVVPLFLHAAFSFGDDWALYENKGGPQENERPQDFFDGFTLTGKCRQCGQELIVAGFECA